MTGQASMWRLSNAKGGKFLRMEPLFWQSEASLEIPWEPRAFSEGQRPSVSFATDERSRLFWERAETDLVEQLASERVFDAKLTPKAVRQRLLPSVRQSRGGDWTLKAKLPAHARFWNAGGTFADRPAELAHCAARVRLRARSLWLMDLRVEPPSRECPLYFLPMPQPFFFSVKKFRMATHVLERRKQLRPVLKAAVDAEALKRGASLEEVSRLHDELARHRLAVSDAVESGTERDRKKKRSSDRLNICYFSIESNLFSSNQFVP